MMPANTSGSFLDEVYDSLEAVNDALNMIGRLPRAGVPYKIGYRKRVVIDFPHAIFYLTYDHFLWVAAIYHGHRQPDGWMYRKRD